MSGRKSTEVAAALAASQKGRQEVEKKLDACLQNARTEYEKNREHGKRLLTGLDNCVLEAPTADAEFPKEMKKLAVRLSACLEKARKHMSGIDRFAPILSERQKIQNILAGLDEQARKIRMSISSKDWYCDEEYAQACKLSSEYRKIYASQHELLTQAEKIARDSMHNRNVISEQAQLAEQIQAEARQLEERAKNRQQANQQKKAMGEELDAIDRQLAEKFLPGQLDPLLKACAETMTLADPAFLASADQLFSKLQDFNRQLAEKVASWQKEKADVEASLAELGRQEDFTLVEPVELYNSGDAGATLPLFTYLKTYAGLDQAPEYSSLKQDLLAEFGRENFAACRALAEKALHFLENTRNTALELQRSMFDKTSLAGALQDTMEKLHYDTELEIVDDNPNNGFILRCRAGDELINFDRIDIDPDGRIVIRLDHHESVGGSCHASWENIARALRKAGIPVTDVKLDGNGSVLAKRTTVVKEQGTQNQIRT